MTYGNAVNHDNPACDDVKHCLTANCKAGLAHLGHAEAFDRVKFTFDIPLPDGFMSQWTVDV